MKTITKIVFFESLLPLVNGFKLYWKDEISPQWLESKTFLKSLLGDYDAFKAFSSQFGDEMTLARVGATLTYLDQYERLNSNFSSFTELAVAMALNLNEEKVKNPQGKKILSSICRLDRFISQALFSSDEEWMHLSHIIKKDLEHLNEHARTLHPLLSPTTLHDFKRAKLKAA